MYIIEYTHQERKRLSSITLLGYEIWLFPKNQSNITKRLRFLKNKMSFQTRLFAFSELGANVR